MVDIRERTGGGVRSPRAGLALWDVVQSHARYRGDQIALIDDERSATWSEFVAHAGRMAAGLAAHGVRRGDVVAIADSMGIDYVAVYYATARVGAVLVPLNTSLHPTSVRSFIERTGAGLVLVGRQHGDLVEAAPGVEVLGGGTAVWGSALTAEGGTPPESDAELDDPHLIIFTSGTTGVPKAAVLSQRATMVDSFAGALATGVRPDERLFVYQAPYHGGTWSMMRQYMLLGGSILMTRRFDAAAALRLIERHRCHSFFAVPLMLQAMVEADGFEQADLSSLRTVVFASYDPNASVLPVVERIRGRGAPDMTIEHIYGQTENSAFIASARPEVCEQHLATVGTPVPGVVLSVQDPEGVEVPRGDVGEICVRSHSVMDGYLDDPEATAAAFRGGWLHTGDLGRLDEDGMLHIVGRLKEMIRTGGVNVYPREVAARLGEHPAIRDCAVFGVPDPRYDERVVAAVVSDDPGLTPDEVVRWVRERMAGYQTPRQVILLDALPKTAAGKTAMADLIDRARRSAGADGERSAS
ncbi:AMP-binding protein [Pseudonocardia kujensis]|uniref:class I adenylate-forming enzyme family protein n=1 Tax=Pseudonocardia kujensis TaxID=1128675 RepID=UPI001E28674F|nr:AMP-binding protein [Pseudonocardia kujensis]MCE0767622.1 AMP-binding protein [Pseudonocardia kujensis]